MNCGQQARLVFLSSSLSPRSSSHVLHVSHLLFFFPPFSHLRSFYLMTSRCLGKSLPLFIFPSFPWSLSRSALLFISTLNYLLVLVCLSPACPPSALSRSFKYLTSFFLKYLFEFKLTALLISLICTMQIFTEIHAQVTRIIDKKYSNYPKIYSFLIFRI